jgi:tripartite-type tricarboxylate transporter receptor subunit TctC
MQREERMITRRHGLAAAAATALAGPVRAADPWPTRPIRLIVPFAPGGFTDIAARLVAVQLTPRLGQTVVVENRAGAAGIIGTEAAARSEPDGYTLVMGGVSTHAMNVTLYRRLPYDPQRDFAAVSGVANGPNILVVHPSLPARDLASLIAIVRERPGRITYGSAGAGTSTHLAGELFRGMAGVDVLHVPFRSTSLATTALLGGQLDMMFDTLASALPHVRDGKLRALAVTSPQRIGALPDMPTMAETLPGFEVGVWAGLFAPAATPRAVVDRIAAAARDALTAPELVARFAELGVAPHPAGPDEYAAFMRAEIERWGAVIRRAGITAD